MNDAKRFALTLGIIGLIFSVFRFDPIILFGEIIRYPKILDVLFLAIVGYNAGHSFDEEYDEAVEQNTYGFTVFIVALIVLLLINFILHWSFSNEIYTYVVLGISTFFGIILALISTNSVFDEKELSALFNLSILVSIPFGIFVGPGLVVIAFILTPVLILGTKRLLKKKLS